MKTDAAAPADSRLHLAIRGYRGEWDIPEIVRVTNAELRADGIRQRVTVDDLTAHYRHPSDSFDAARNVLVAEVDGQVTGVVRVDWTDTTDGVREYRTSAVVHPDWRRRGIGRRLLHAAQGLMRAHAASHPVDRPRVMGLFVEERQVGRRALGTSEGYEPARWFFEMERAGIDGELPERSSLPDGLGLRPATRDDARAIWDADHEAFRDHWGGWDASDASFRRWTESPEFQPDLFVVAWDGDQVAGAVINAIYAEENAELGLRRGWLDSVFTRRPWRGRGLARALIGHSLHLLARRGMDTAALGVDADNPSGALGLYESCGFVVTERASAWRKPLVETAP